jgi:hypothetical protein
MTPFLLFWKAVNLYRASRNLPELTYGPARRLWLQVEMML